MKSCSSADAPHLPKVAVLLAYAQDPVAWQNRFERGEVMDRTPYGYERASAWFDMRWARSHQEGRVISRVRRALCTHLGFDLVHAWRNKSTLRTASIIWTHTEREHLAVALLQRLRVLSPRQPVLAQSVWLWDEWQHYPCWRRRMCAWLLRTHPAEFVHSPANRAIADEFVPRRRVLFLPFGTSSPFEFTRSTEQTMPAVRADVVAVGSDIHRDWRTLAAAATALPDLQFRVASASHSARAIDWPPNVTVERVTSVASLRSLYAHARVVVVPLATNSHASGLTAALEALDAGCPLIVTNVGGIDAYLADAACLIPDAGAAALTRAIADAVGGVIEPPPQHVREERGLTQADYVGRYVLLSQALLKGHPLPEQAVEFQPVEVTPARRRRVP